MATKKTDTGKKETAGKKKATSAAKKTTPNTKNAIEAQDLATMPDEIKTLAATHEPSVKSVPTNLVYKILSDVTDLMNEFQAFSDNNLTQEQLRRKIGAGVRNYGFIEKVADLAAANPEYAQFFSVQNLRNTIRNIDNCRDIVLLLQAFARAVSNSMLVYSDEAFTMSLIYYNMVRQMSRRGDPVATVLFNTLRPFFRRRTPTTAEPTAKQLEKDIHGLLHGTKDGEIVIKNETPRASGGVHEVIDNVRSGRTAIKGTVEESIDEK